MRERSKRRAFEAQVGLCPRRFESCSPFHCGTSAGEEALLITTHRRVRPPRPRPLCRLGRSGDMARGCGPRQACSIQAVGANTGVAQWQCAGLQNCAVVVQIHAPVPSLDLTMSTRVWRSDWPRRRTLRYRLHEGTRRDFVTKSDQLCRSYQSGPGRWFNSIDTPQGSWMNVSLAPAGVVTTGRSSLTSAASSRLRMASKLSTSNPT
jgi:hypothetical protein